MLVVFSSAAWALLPHRRLCAACSGHVSCMEYLMEEGADIEQRNVVRPNMQVCD